MPRLIFEMFKLQISPEIKASLNYRYFDAKGCTTIFIIHLHVYYSTTPPCLLSKTQLPRQ